MQLGPPRTGSGMSFMAGSFLRPLLGQWQTSRDATDSCAWGEADDSNAVRSTPHGGPLS